jgi:hypothetical protein
MKILNWFWYAAFIEKKWQIASINVPSVIEPRIELDLSNAQIFPKFPGVSIVADPCAHLCGETYAEYVSKYTGLGKIGAWDGRRLRYLNLPKMRHYSFPQIIEEDSKLFLFPEVSKHEKPVLYQLNSNHEISSSKFYLKGLEDFRLIDSVLYKHGNTWFLFATCTPEKFGRLRLWSSNTLRGKFEEHPMSPISVGASAGRMAGPIHIVNGNLYRFAQNSEFNYGGRVAVIKIQELSTDTYKESMSGVITVKSYFGPHTILIHDDRMFFDFYSEKVSLFIGFRRISSIVLNFASSFLTRLNLRGD